MHNWLDVDHGIDRTRERKLPINDPPRHELDEPVSLSARKPFRDGVATQEGAREVKNEELVTETAHHGVGGDKNSAQQDYDEGNLKGQTVHKEMVM